MKLAIRQFGVVLLAMASFAFVVPRAEAQKFDKLQQPGQLPAGVRPRQLEGVGVEEKLGNPIDLNLQFIAENGYPVALSELFHKGHPVILNLVYFTCPMLCTLVLNGETEAMRAIPWTPGKEYEVVTISIDPNDNFGTAREKKALYLKSFDRPAAGWHFLVDKDGNAKRLAEQMGFHYRYDERIQQFAHPAAIMILTPEGRISRYLYGVRYSPRDVRFALAEASEGRTTMALEKILLFCYHYDPTVGSYTVFAMNLMRGGAAATVALLAWYILWMFRAEKKRAATYAAMGLAGMRAKGSSPKGGLA
jgi:protein SCO1